MSGRLKSVRGKEGGREIEEECQEKENKCGSGRGGEGDRERIGVRGGERKGRGGGGEGK